MMLHTPSHRTLLTAAALILATQLLGCQSTPKTQSGSDAMSYYRMGNYQQAYKTAVAQAGSTHGSTADQAHFIAGMSAYKLGNESEAINHLTLATNSHDDALSGPANATLGLVFANRREYPSAIMHFQRAVRQLHGQDRANAYFQLGSAEQKLGRWASARTDMSMAISNSSDADFRKAVSQRMDAHAYTLQFGAFSRKPNAADKARQVASQTQAAGLGNPIIVSAEAGGNTLFLVQAGSYSTYDEALAARRRIPRTDVIVTRKGD